MRALAWAALSLLLLGLVAGIGLALIAPRLLASAELRAQLLTAAEEALGRECDYGALELGLFPPSLVIVGPVVAGEAPEAEPFAVAERVALYVALLPLLDGLLWIDSLVVEGARLRLVRTAEGLLLPGPSDAFLQAGVDTAPEAGAAGEREDLAFAVREVVLRDTALLFEDRTRTPVLRWQLAPLEIEARGRAAAEPFALSLSLAGPRGGKLEVRGTATLEARVDLRTDLAGFDLASLRPFLAPAAEVAGLVSGSIDTHGPIEALERVSFDLELRDADCRLDEVHVAGAVSVRGEVVELAAPTGRFEADATAAEVRYGEVFEKPPGIPAQLEGRIVSGPDGLEFDDVRLQIQGMDARDSGEPGRRTRLSLRVEP